MSTRPIPPAAVTPLTDKAKALQDQVDSKIHWDTPDEEVLDWLGDKHSIEGDDAALMLKNAKRTRARAIRERAIYGMIFSLVGLFITGLPLFLSFYSGDVFSKEFVALAVASFLCLIWFFKCLARFVMGRTSSTID